MLHGVSRVRSGFIGDVGEMSETANIQEMAEKLFVEIFEVFGWSRCGGFNRNWDCKDPERHDGRATHPSDVVGAYKDPYTPNVVLVNADLKSLKKESITLAGVERALFSLAQAVECVHKSEDWQTAYTNGLSNWDAVGMLLIYNNDNQYDESKWPSVLTAIDEAYRLISKGRRVYIVGPGDVRHLLTVATDLIRFSERCGGERQFYSHQGVIHRAARVFQSSATLEMLLGPLLIVRLRDRAPLKRKNDHPALSDDWMVVYYRGPGTSINEFVYLIDVIFRLDLLRESNSRIDLKLTAAASNATETWAHAVDTYVSRYPNIEDMRVALAQIKPQHATRYAEVFFQKEIGMRTS